MEVFTISGFTHNVHPSILHDDADTIQSFARILFECDWWNVSKPGLSGRNFLLPIYELWRRSVLFSSRFYDIDL